MIETATLATYVVGSFLVPLLKKGADKLTDDLGAKVGATASEGLVGAAKKLWEKARGKTRGTSDAPVVDLEDLLGSLGVARIRARERRVRLVADDRR